VFTADPKGFLAAGRAGRAARVALTFSSQGADVAGARGGDGGREGLEFRRGAKAAAPALIYAREFSLANIEIR
jgi:hypothetical protein